MLAFADQKDLSAWLQAHAQKPSKFRCNGKLRIYYLVDENFNPDMGICFGYAPNNHAFFISDNTPVAVRTLILQIEYRRINPENLEHPKSHCDTLRYSLDKMPDSPTKELLVTTLTEFYSNLVLHFEHGDLKTPEYKDVHAALAYLRSL